MKYRDTIQFEPLETTIQIGQADRKETAVPLVSSYVISDEMAERLSNVLFPQLQFEYPADNKGLLIVGNYGTGKSHLMSLISAIAEHADLVEYIKNPRVRAEAISIAGKFKVARTELNTTMPLRDAMCSTIEIIRLEEPSDIFPAYERALLRDDGRSTILVEYGDYYSEK